MFYGDIFLINKKGCLIFGYGKSKASSQASGNLIENDISRDFAMIARESNNDVYGWFEPSFVPIELINPDFVPKKVKIEYMLMYLDEQETKKYYENSKLEIKNIDYNTFLGLAEGNINMGQGLDAFKEITLNSNVVCKIVPYTENFNDKIILLKTQII